MQTPRRNSRLRRRAKTYRLLADTHVEQRDAGAAFGEAAGVVVGTRSGTVPLIVDSRSGIGKVDQVWKTVDNSDLYLHECKGPSAKLRTRQVTLPDGTTVEARQGSTVYMWRVLRLDTELRSKVLADPGLVEGLLDGTTRVHVRLVQPDRLGHIREQELLIDQGKLDIAGWLAGG